MLPRLRNWLGAPQGEASLTAYNCDLDIAAYYLYSRRPLALSLV